MMMEDSDRRISKATADQHRLAQMQNNPRASAFIRGYFLACRTPTELGNQNILF
ncbi:MAG: hypothetical protein ACYC6G_03720 [Desulfobaccales bacterium]